MWLVLGVGCVVSCEFRPLHCRDLGPTDRFLVQQTTPFQPFQSLQRWLSEYPSAPVIWNVLLKRNNPVGKRRVAVIGGAGGIGFHFAEFLLLHQQQSRRQRLTPHLPRMSIHKRLVVSRGLWMRRCKTGEAGDWRRHHGHRQRPDEQTTGWYSCWF